MATNGEHDYYRFTGPQRLAKAMHTLEGLLRGYAADRTITASEAQSLKNWLAEHAEFESRHPFSEVVPQLRDALADGVLDHNEVEDILWLCAKFARDGGYFSFVTSDMQRLQAMIGAVAADGTITVEELEALQAWMETHDHLRKCWPYDELEALILGVLKDRWIDDQEHSLLMAFFADFLSTSDHRALVLPLNEVNTPISGLCAVCPELVFPDKLFCFTGASARYTRDQLAQVVQAKGGRFSRNLRQDVDYLVIGAEGNPCWAYACYGRKVQAAVEHRKQGSQMLLVHENDFWDAVGDIPTSET